MSDSNRAQVYLRRGRERALLDGSPWVYSGAVERVEGQAEPGAVVEVRDASRRLMAVALWNPDSQIALRVLEPLGPDAPPCVVDDAFWRRRVQRAWQWRQQLPARAQTDAVRVVHAEADGIPGLIADLYGEWLVVQLASRGVERARASLLAALVEVTGARGVWHRSDPDIAAREGLTLVDGLLAGDEPPPRVLIREHGLTFEVDVREGQKTGFFLDQRDNRQRVASFLANYEVLDAFSYSGGFGLAALRGGARRVLHLDASPVALAQARAHRARNGLAAPPEDFLEENAFEALRAFRDRGRSFDAIILDPPKFAFHRAQIERALRGYKDINLLALKILRPGGVLATFSCSGAIRPELFREMLRQAALDAGRTTQLVATLGAAPDHPVLLGFESSEYLKGCILRVAARDCP